MYEKGDVKYGSGVGDLVLLEVVIETSSRSSGKGKENLSMHKINNNISLIIIVNSERKDLHVHVPCSC